MKLNFQPIVIIGAPRSGTNMLRDALTRIPGVDTWPCDEINCIWRHSNVRHSTDEFTPDMATQRVKNFVRARFASLNKRRRCTYLVEKTCANSLRVAFVNELLPEARFIHLIRDGRDAAVSAAKRWPAGMNMPYLLRKARYVPLSDLPYFAWRFFSNRFHRMVSPNCRARTWGPVFAGLDVALRQRPLVEVCALQWQRCVERSSSELGLLAADRVHHVRYEDFVEEPVSQFNRIVQFVGTSTSQTDSQEFVKNASKRSVGAAAAQLTCAELQALTSLLQPTLERHGYTTTDIAEGRPPVSPLEGPRRALLDPQGDRRWAA